MVQTRDNDYLSRFGKSIKKVLAVIFVFLAVQVAFAKSEIPSDSASFVRADSLRDVRGLFRDVHYTDDNWRSLLDAITWTPRESISALLYSTGRGMYQATDPRVIEQIQEFLYFYDKHLGWLPAIELDSDFKPQYGARIFYHQSAFGTLLKGRYSSASKWKTKVQVSLRSLNVEKPWKFTLTGEQTEDDDFQFYGIGVDPQNDPRSHFAEGNTQEMAEYFQHREKIQLIFGAGLNPSWDLFLTAFYQQREIRDVSSDGQFIRVFDTVELLENEPGAKEPTVYSEIAVRVKTGNGIIAETYAGHQTNVNSKGSFLRLGTDWKAVYPVFRKNRVIIPRLVFNMVENLSPNDPIVFYDYPRHPTYRGVSGRKLLRQDNLQFIPSIEYQWPLTTTFSGFLFSDFLIVSRTLDKLSIHQAPWAAGMGLKFGLENYELGQFQFAYGSQGFRLILHYGASGFDNARSEWK